jgi:tetratricopeptide (TPR) repeat protein
MKIIRWAKLQFKASMFTRRAQLSFIAFLIILPDLFVLAAEGDQNSRWCHGEDNATAEQRLNGCTAVIKQNSNRDNVAYAYNARGSQYYYNGLHTRAIKDYDHAIRLKPDYAQAVNNRCWVRAVVGHLNDALKDCDKAVELQPNVGNSFENRAFVYLRLGQLKKAIADYNRALKLDPESADDLYGRGLARLKSGDKEGGQADIAAAKTKKPWIVDEFIRYGIRAP